MIATELMAAIICMVCVVVIVVMVFPENFVISQDLYDKAPVLFKLCVILVLSIVIAGTLYISWLRPLEVYYSGL